MKNELKICHLTDTLETFVSILTEHQQFIWINQDMFKSTVKKLKQFFHKLQDRDNLPLQLPVLKINNYEIKRSTSIKFLGIMVDEHLNWKDHINVIENKLSKNLGLLHKAKQFLNAKAMKSLYFSFIHSYLTYGNVAWCSTSMNKTKKLFSKQKLVYFRIFSIMIRTVPNQL